MPTKNKKSSQQSQKKDSPIQKRVEATLTRLERKDPGLKKLLAKAHGYAVFPSVGKAALVVGGAYGRGAVFEKGKMIGHATLSQVTLGVQIGGDTFTEIVVFHDKGALDRFKRGQMAFAANASAVLVKAAAAGTSNFGGVTAHAYSSGGMLLELSIGGQKFNFRPLGDGKEETGGKGPKAQAGGGAEEGEESEEGSGNLLSRAVEGVRGATSKVGDIAKERPIAATVAGVALTAGLALLIMRAMRQKAGDDTKSKGRRGEDEDEDAEETEAQGRDDRGDEDEASDDEGDDAADEDGDEDEESNNHVGMKRRHRFRA